MKQKEAENIIRRFGHNDSIEFKGEIYEYVSRNANPVLLTILTGRTMFVPIFI